METLENITKNAKTKVDKKKSEKKFSSNWNTRNINNSTG